MWADDWSSRLTGTTTDDDETIDIEIEEPSGDEGGFEMDIESEESGF